MGRQTVELDQSAVVTFFKIGFVYLRANHILSILNKMDINGFFATSLWYRWFFLLEWHQEALYFPTTWNISPYFCFFNVKGSLILSNELKKSYFSLQRTPSFHSQSSLHNKHGFSYLRRNKLWKWEIFLGVIWRWVPCSRGKYINMNIWE